MKLMAALVLALCPVASYGGERSAIEKTLRAYEDAYNRRDAKALTAVYTPDGLLLPQGRAAVKGASALEAFWTKSMGRDLKLDLSGFEASGDVGWAAGAWSLGPSEARASGHFMVGLKKGGDGTWRMSADTFNEGCRR